MSEQPAAHRPVLLARAIDALVQDADGVYLDGTYGRGGHSDALLARLGSAGSLIALDRDPEAIAASQSRRDPRFRAVHARMSELDQVLDRMGVPVLSGILLDLGVSSPQLDTASRGFSFRADGPLDMRMDTTRGESAAQWLATVAEPELRGVIRDYGEERFAKQIAAAIIAARGREPIIRTQQLAAIVAAAVRTHEPGKDPATRSFQALRIFINQELEEIALVLPQATRRLAAGGRLVVISFHSLEDRMVKRFMAQMARPDVPRNLPLRASEMPHPALKIVGRAIRPSDEEIAANPRARSALMRVAERTAAPMSEGERSRRSEWRS